jgi:hypothetical protein
MHLFADISSHGLGHLAIAAPIINALGAAIPGLRLTLRSALPAATLGKRIAPAFSHLSQGSDFGFVMRDALALDLAASAAAYRREHADWTRRVAAEARCLRDSGADLVLSSVSYLPLAGAAAAGIPAAAVCSLNWADLFAHFFCHQAWAGSIHGEMLAAYRAAGAFLRPTPAMPMDELDNRVDIGVVARPGQRRPLGFPAGRRNVLVALGGIAHRLPLEAWPHNSGLRWLVPAVWDCRHPDAVAAESCGLDFPDLLASVDAVLTKPGYGTFTEAAACATPVLYVRRDDWPEQDCLIAWLHTHGACREVSARALNEGGLEGELQALWSQPPPMPPATAGAADAVAHLLQLAR